MVGDDKGLYLLGDTEYRGGELTGLGHVHQVGNARVTQATEIAVIVYNWDGENLLYPAPPSNTTIAKNAAFTIDGMTSMPPGSDGHD